ncbi:MAG: hypothetical protein NVSMB39_4050 [Candidatus Saccharimonadales bacterium]
MIYSADYDYFYNGTRPNPLARLPDFSLVPLPEKGDRWTSGEAAVTAGLSDFLGQAKYTTTG